MLDSAGMVAREGWVGGIGLKRILASAVRLDRVVLLVLHEKGCAF